MEKAILLLGTLGFFISLVSILVPLRFLGIKTRSEALGGLAISFGLMIFATYDKEPRQSDQYPSAVVTPTSIAPTQPKSVPSVDPAPSPLPDKTGPQATAPRPAELSLSERMPPMEKAFVDAIESATIKFNAAQNDLQAGGTRSRRASQICGVIKSLTVKNWIGKIYRLTSNGDGKGVVMLTITDKITVKTWNNAFADVSDNTLVDPRSQLFRSASELSVGDEVIFSGTFVPSKLDCVRESSLTLSGSMEEPEFIMRFSDIKKLP